MEEIHFSLFFILNVCFCLQDFKEQIIHHIATITLISFSWLVNYIRAGTLIMIVHDASDYLMEVRKRRFLSKFNTVKRLHDDAKIRNLITKPSLPSRGGVVKKFLSLISVSQNVQLRGLEEDVQLHLHNVCSCLHYHAPGHPPLLVCFFNILNDLDLSTVTSASLLI